MYKDKDRQREANREAQTRFKAKAKGITSEGITNGVLPEYPKCETLLVNAEPNTGDKRLKDYYDKHREITKPKRGKDIKCFNDLPQE